MMILFWIKNAIFLKRWKIFWIRCEII